MSDKGKVYSGFGFYVTRDGGGVVIEHDLKESVAMYSISNTSFRLYFEMIFNRKNDEHPIRASISFENARRINICQSNSTFSKVKKELVEKGLLDQMSSGGAGMSAIFEFSNRWRYYGTDKFVYKPYNSGGIGGKNSSDW